MTATHSQPYRINSLVTLHHLLRFVAPLFGEKTALVDGVASCSYAGLEAEVSRMAALLAEKGVVKGDRVAIYAPKSLATVQAMIACNALGATFIPVNPQLKAAQLGYILADSGSSCLLAGRHRLDALAAELDLSAITTAALDGELLAEQGDKPTLAPVNMTDGDPAVILYTSGSTGNPKGVVLTQRNLLAGATSVADYLGVTPDDVILGILPLSFDAGLSQLTIALAAGATYVVHEYLAAAQAVKACQRHAVTLITCVPPMWFLLAEAAWPDCPSVRAFANTGGHMPAELLARLRALFPQARPFLMYGLTEAFRSTYLDPEQAALRPGSIGKAVPNAEVIVVRPDGSECAPGEAGELVHRGGFVTLGYLNAHERSAERFKPWPRLPRGLARPEIAVWSGDIVRRDTEGYLYFLGRTDEQIKTSGHRVSPNEIEAVLHAYPGVARAAVLGIEHERLGQQVVACIAPGVDFDEAALGAHCKRLLPGFMQPRQVLLFDTLPLNANGKIDRPRLKLQAAERIAAEEAA